MRESQCGVGMVGSWWVLLMLSSVGWSGLDGGRGGDGGLSSAAVRTGEFGLV